MITHNTTLNALALNNRADTHLKLGRYRDALANATEAIDLAPELAIGHVTRGQALCALGRYNQAAESYEHAIQLITNGRSLHLTTTDLPEVQRLYEQAHPGPP